jgi:hypothetical protein
MVFVTLVLSKVIAKLIRKGEELEKLETEKELAESH